MRTKMKRLLGILLAAAMLLSLAACGGSGEESHDAIQEPAETQEPAQSPASQEPEAASPEEAQPSDGGSGILVAYYSATGNTRSVAEAIANTTGGELFEIVPAEPYSSGDLNWTDNDSRVSREHNDPSLREMELASPNPDNWANCDTVFLGYPIWWGIAAWPLDAFVKANDFTGKTVIPFATSSSSGLGDSAELLSELAGAGDWQEGQRFRSSAGEADVAEWVNGLGLQ